MPQEYISSKDQKFPKNAPLTFSIWFLRNLKKLWKSYPRSKSSFNQRENNVTRHHGPKVCRREEIFEAPVFFCFFNDTKAREKRAVLSMSWTLDRIFCLVENESEEFFTARKNWYCLKNRYPFNLHSESDSEFESGTVRVKCFCFSVVVWDFFFASIAMVVKRLNLWRSV